MKLIGIEVGLLSRRVGFPLERSFLRAGSWATRRGQSLSRGPHLQTVCVTTSTGKDLPCMVVEPRQPTGEMCGQVLGQRHETPPAQPLPTATNDAAQPALALPLQLLNSSSFMKAG